MISRSIGRILKIMGYTTLGGVAALCLAATLYLNSLSELDPWHTVHFHEEFQADSPAKSLQEYIAIEDRLFDELKRELLDQLSFGNEDEINRFQPGSVSNPQNWPQNWNRTYLLEHQDPVASVLLLHGMSNSPYSLRTIGDNLHKDGATVLGLRLPGHGTAPAGLLDITAEDLIAATELAVKALHNRAPDRPVYLVGYSNGAALGVVYALNQINTPGLPPIDRIAIISPAIGVTPTAAYAPIAIKLGHMLGVQRLSWSSIGPEYDPYKYTSFAINAGYVTHRLTQVVKNGMAQAKASGTLNRLPPIQGFSSVVDATVVVQDMITNLYVHLPANQSELLLFDTNHFLTRLPLLDDPSADFLSPLLAETPKNYELKLITNTKPHLKKVELRSFVPGSNTPGITPIPAEWPDGVFSLAHVSLPFPTTDPLYGIVPAPETSRLQLGGLALRGERGISKIPATDMLRLRWNPFYFIMMSEMRDFFGLSGDRRSTPANN